MDKKIAIMETFYSLQGEGLHSGRAAYFIRTAGCPVRCEWCDVKESWEATGYPRLTPKEIVEQIPSEVKVAVVTGGEPLIWDMTGLTSALRERGIATHVETSGCMPICAENWDWVCVSPKKNKAPLSDVLSVADELKVVIGSKEDFIWAEENAKMVSPDTALLLQVQWDTRDEVMPLICEYVKSNPKWRVSLQTHKYMNIP